MRQPLVYDAVMVPFETLVLKGWRRWAVSGLSGKLLEIGAGTGFTLRHYGSLSMAVITEPSLPMLRRARQRARGTPFTLVAVAADAQELPFASDTFDAVVVTLALCTVPSPDRALREIRRVLRPNGELRLLEHVRVSNPPVAALQDMLTPVWRAVSGGCHLNRDTLQIAVKAGFAPVQLRVGMGGWLMSAHMKPREP